MPFTILPTSSQQQQKTNEDELPVNSNIPLNHRNKLQFSSSSFSKHCQSSNKLIKFYGTCHFTCKNKISEYILITFSTQGVKNLSGLETPQHPYVRKVLLEDKDESLNFERKRGQKMSPTFNKIRHNGRP